jgi:signal transduction histidine kinase
MLGWLTWASDAMALLLKRVGEHLGRLNAALQENQVLLESRIAERTRQLQESQAHVLHQEKMAAFGLLAAGIAHEVGNPLTSISSLVQMIQRRDSDAYTQEKLRLVSGQLQRIQTTLRELVNFSRPASTTCTRVAIGDILEEARNIAKYHKLTKGKVVELKVADDLPPILGVHDQLVQVFLNLILNAIEATGKDGRIEVTADGSEAGVEVRVSDNGAGIAPEHQARLFEPYFTTKNHGTGLGLFVTHRLVTDHGGQIEFESRMGHGTIFRIRLPLAPQVLGLKENAVASESAVC